MKVAPPRFVLISMRMRTTVDVAVRIVRIVTACMLVGDDAIRGAVQPLRQVVASREWTCCCVGPACFAAVCACTASVLYTCMLYAQALRVGVRTPPNTGITSLQTLQHGG